MDPRTAADATVGGKAPAADASVETAFRKRWDPRRGRDAPTSRWLSAALALAEAERLGHAPETLSEIHWTGWAAPGSAHRVEYAVDDAGVRLAVRADGAEVLKATLASRAPSRGRDPRLDEDPGVLGCRARDLEVGQGIALGEGRIAAAEADAWARATGARPRDGAVSPFHLLAAWNARFVAAAAAADLEAASRGEPPSGRGDPTGVSDVSYARPVAIGERLSFGAVVTGRRPVPGEPDRAIAMLRGVVADAAGVEVAALTARLPWAS